MGPKRLSALNGEQDTAIRSHSNAKGLDKAANPTDLKTDYSRWRMLDENGRQTWHYLTSDAEVEEWPQTITDKHYLGLPTVSNLG